MSSRATNVHSATLHMLGDLRGRIDADLAALRFSPDGSLMGVEEGGVFRRWDGATLELLESAIVGDGEAVWTFSRNGRWLAGGGDSLSLWNVEQTPTPVATSAMAWTTAMAFNPNGDALAVGDDDGRVLVFGVPDLKLKATLVGGHGPISALAFSDGGMFVAVADESRTIRLWGWEEEALLRTLEGCTDRIEALAWSPDNRRLASAGWDQSVRVWDIRAAELAFMLNDHSPKVLAATFVPESDGKLIASGDCAGDVRIWDVATLTVKSKLTGHAEEIKRLSFSADGSKLAVGGDDRVVSVWDWRAGEPLVPLSDSKTGVVNVVGGADRIAVLHSDGSLRWWTVDGNHLEPAEPNATAAAFDATHGWAVGTNAGSVKLPHVAQKHWRSHDGAVRRLAFNPTGNRLVTIHDGDATLRLWDPATGELKVVVPEASLGGMVEAAVFHPSDPVLAVAGVDWKDGRLVDPKISLSMWASYVPPKGAIVAQPRSAFHPEGAVVLWDMRTWTIRQILDGGALRLAFHPSGKCLATISSDGAPLVWDHVTGELLNELPFDGPRAADLAFDPSGRWLAVGGADGLLRLWDCKTWRTTNAAELESAITALAFTSDGAKLVVGFANGAAAVLGVGDLAR
jgi:WD40 repeat protein